MSTSINRKPDRSFYLIGEVSSANIYSITTQLSKRLEMDIMRKTKKEIFLYVNCNGGDLETACGFYDWVRFLNLPLVTIAHGIIASAGLIIFLAGKKRYSLEHTRFYLHQIKQPIVEGNYDVDETAYFAQSMKDYQNIYLKILQSNCKLTEKNILTHMARNKYFNSDIAQDFGMINQILLPKGLPTPHITKPGLKLVSK
jgi:ATP-dependent Clp protease protease subunit